MGIHVKTFVASNDTLLTTSQVCRGQSCRLLCKVALLFILSLKEHRVWLEVNYLLELISKGLKLTFGPAPRSRCRLRVNLELAQILKGQYLEHQK